MEEWSCLPGSFHKVHVSTYVLHLTPSIRMHCVVFIHLLFGMEVSDSESFTGLWRRTIDVKEVRLTVIS